MTDSPLKSPGTHDEALQHAVRLLGAKLSQLSSVSKKQIITRTERGLSDVVNLKCVTE